MEHRVRVNFLGAALVVVVGAGVSLVTSTVVASRAYQNRVVQAARVQQDLTVKGYARARVRSDIAVWQVDVTGEAEQLDQAYDELQAGVGRVQRFLADRGIDEGDIQLGPIATDTHRARDDEGNRLREIAGYTLRRSLTVTTSDVDRVRFVAADVTSLVKEGVHMTSRAPEFTFSKVGDVKLQILGEASANARARAVAIATEAGSSVGTVRDARQGVIQITRPDSTEVSSYGIYDTSTIQKDVSVVVTVTFAIDDP